MKQFRQAKIRNDNFLFLNFDLFEWNTITENKDKINNDFYKVTEENNKLQMDLNMIKEELLLGYRVF